MPGTIHTAPPAGAHDDSRPLGLLDAIDELNRGLNLLVALQMAVETLDGPDRNGLAELVAATRSKILAGRDRVDAVRGTRSPSL
ncbi:hypothetical protein [Salinarimonas ramus]|uniref:Uncharacterized protein n=1 Tax=Salinarimonas ramus TaxID=690164 RepID=A0A917V2K4_9HYPH|nr:hypothetical protein [Salinarimonas ramus]GGK23852.1 hypothetical protein GCM10011322_08110 [Salinarimonas ramus]